MKKKIYQKNYFINVMIIESSFLKMILKWNILFMYPNREYT